MQKIVIPGILAVTIWVAVMFAIMPVERASTVHDPAFVNTAVLFGTANLAGGALAEGAREIVAVTVTGADTTNDLPVCVISKNDDFDNVGIVEAEITAANTVTVQVQNLNETAATPDVTTDAADAVACFVIKRP